MQRGLELLEEELEVDFLDYHIREDKFPHFLGLRRESRDENKSKKAVLLTLSTYFNTFLRIPAT